MTDDEDKQQAQTKTLPLTALPAAQIIKDLSIMERQRNIALRKQPLHPLLANEDESEPELEHLFQDNHKGVFLFDEDLFQMESINSPSTESTLSMLLFNKNIYAQKNKLPKKDVTISAHSVLHQHVSNKPKEKLTASAPMPVGSLQENDLPFNLSFGQTDKPSSSYEWVQPDDRRGLGHTLRSSSPAISIPKKTVNK